LFSSYQSIDDDVVLIGNDISCKIVGIGRINITMLDGIVITLMDFRHVLEIKRNLISFGFLDSGGYNITCQGGALKVCKRILVVLKDTNIGKLYKLEGNTQVNESTMVSKEEQASSCLWHQRLGHLSKKGCGL
jgi:hypothetical protein